jgi:hypothetical protein
VKLPNHTALKEWASVVSALSSGDQVILVRKGGIEDSRFAVESDRFYLFPTYLHQKERQFKPEFAWHARQCESAPGNPPIPISTWCEVVTVLELAELELLQAIEPFVIFTRETLEQRYNFRRDQAVQVIAVRSWRLPRIAAIADHADYAGCRSWLSLDEEIEIDGSERVLPEELLQERIDGIRRAVRAG